MYISFVAIALVPWYQRGMSDLVQQLELPSDYSAETLHVKRMKEQLVAYPKERGDQVCFTFKMSRARHAQLLAVVDRHDMTITDVLTLHVDQILPVLQKAKKVIVPGYSKDKRTNPGRKPRHREHAA